jgi:hydrogenase maturation protease
MSRRDGPLLVLGVGNILLRDEGIGVHVARALEELPEGSLPCGTRIVDGGTLGLDLLPMLDDAAAVVMVDAVDLRMAPGTVGIIRGSDLHGALAGHVSPHQVGIGDLLASARLSGTLPEQVSLVAIQPGEIEIGLDLTPSVQAAVPVAVGAVQDELERMTCDPGSVLAPAV